LLIGVKSVKKYIFSNLLLTTKKLTMKFFTLLCITLFFISGLVAQDTIPNPGFEAWTYNPVPPYNTPNDWTTLNPLTGALNVFTAYKDSTTVHSGHYSIKLVTKSVAGETAPGVVTTGTVNVASNTITGGIPISSRPTALTGWYQYAPVSGDSAGLSITLTKWDATGDSEIVVGAGNVYGSTNSSWTEFTVPVTYFSNSTPDTVLLLFTSSGGAVSQVGSSLWLDDLSYSYTPLGIKEVTNNLINVYPNPANQQINIANQNAQINNLNICTIDGQVAKLVRMHEGLNTIDVSALSAGFYVLNGIGAGGITYHTTVVIDK
jgi:hypothetical protein